MHTIKQCFQLELTWFFMELVHCVPYVTAALQRLDLRECTSLDDVPYLSSIRGLKVLWCYD